MLFRVAQTYPNNGMFYEMALPHTAALTKGGVSEFSTECLSTFLL
jgi:hypothetical protein